MTHVSMTPTARPVRNPVPKSTSLSQQTPTQPQQASVAQNQPKFGGSKFQQLQNHIDFKQLGASHIAQIQIIYASCILWRLVAANERRKASPSKSYNEIRESILRDSMGYMFWFFGVPIMQRGYLATVPKDIRQSLIQANPSGGKGIKGFLNKMNPLSNWAIPTSEQVKDQMKQALIALEKRGIKPTDTAFKTTETFYTDLVKHRNIATGIGLGATIILLGVGINLLNFYMTRRNVERRKAELLQQQQKTTLPPPPRYFGLPAQQTGAFSTQGTLQNPWQAFQQRPMANRNTN